MKRLILAVLASVGVAGCATQVHRAGVLVREYTVTPPASWKTARWTDQWTPAMQLNSDRGGCASVAAAQGVSGGTQLVDALTGGPLRDLVEGGAGGSGGDAGRAGSLPALSRGEGVHRSDEVTGGRA